MFTIGRSPPTPPHPPRVKRILIPPSSAPVTPKFTGQPKSWLLLPRTDLSFFQRQLDLTTTNSFTEPYLASLTFCLTFAATSVAYGMGAAAFPTYLTHDAICESVNAAYRKNMKIRWAMKRLMNFWRLKHIRVMNEEDIATQETPKKRVVFIDWKTRTSYQFEAITILRDTINRLLNHDQLFLEPLPPRNPYTNSPLSYGGLVSLHDQLHRVGVTHWLWEAFASVNFNIGKLENRHEVPMKLRCLDIIISDKTNYITIDFIMDFIIGEYTHHIRYGPPSESLVLHILLKKWDNPVIQEWVALCKTYWTNEICGRSDDNLIVRIKSERLIRSMKSWYTI